MGRSRRKEPEPPEPEIYVPYDIADLSATNKRPNRAGTPQGNPLGVINGCGGRGQPADLDDDRAADFGGGFDDPFLPAQDRAKRKNKEKLDQNWRAAAPALRGHYISLAPLYAHWQDEESLLKEQALNKRIESALHFHTSKCALCSEEARAREPEVSHACPLVYAHLRACTCACMKFGRACSFQSASSVPVPEMCLDLARKW